MNTNLDEPGKSETLATLTDLVCRSAEPPTPAQLGRGLLVVSGSLALDRERRRALWRISLAGMMLVTACAAASLGIVAFSRARRLQSVAPPLLYRAEGGTVIEGGYLRESGSGGIKLTFSEGTTLALMPGTHGRLRSVDSAGARLAIENGTVLCRVVPRGDAKWLVDVGPFLVTVNGTVFTVSWDAAHERFDLSLREGRVMVSGPVSGGDLALRAGHRLVVDLRKSETVITEEQPEELSARSGASPSAVPVSSLPALLNERRWPDGGKPGRRGGVGAPSGSADVKVAAPSRWTEAVAAADWDRILREAEASGVKSTLERASSQDLCAFADAARYRRRMAVAREALLAQRRRFPGSARSLDAAYLLGRVEESSERATVEALRWYDEYLRHSPTGTYASEALGRKMILTGKLDGASQTRPLAEEYLRRFPNGAYSGSARALLQSP